LDLIMGVTSTKRIIPGLIVEYKGKTYCVEDLINTTTVVIRDDKGRRESVKASDLSIPESASEAVKDLTAVEGRAWSIAKSQYEIIYPLLLMDKNERTREAVRLVAEKNGYVTATVYRWIQKYQSHGHITSLMRKSRGDKGNKRLGTEVDSVITEMIEKFYLTDQRSSVKRVIQLIGSACMQRELNPPAASTVYRRISAISGEIKTARRYSTKVAQEKFQPIRGKFPDADFPLAVVQIDHTKVDVIVVDEKYRLPIGRAFLTIATDLYSKMCVGFYLSLDPVGTVAMGQCIANAILPKDEYLTKLGIDPNIYQWPCWGTMRRIHSDNAKEFHGNVLARAAEEYGIILERRPKRATRFGGDVERTFRTYMGTVHSELPGTTFSNVESKYEYDSEGKAIISLSALEKWFVLYLLGEYHHSPHEGNNNIPPIEKWERGVFGTDTEVGTGLPVAVKDEMRLRINLLPYEYRTVQRSGVEFESMSYWNPSIQKYINTRDPKNSKSGRKFLIRYDPRDVSVIWFYDPESNQHILLANRSRKDFHISLWELRALKRDLASKGHAVNQKLIYQSINERSLLIETEANLTKLARKNQEKSKQQKKSSLKAKQKQLESEATNVSEETIQTWNDNDIQPFEISGDY